MSMILTLLNGIDNIEYVRKSFDNGQSYSGEWKNGNYY